jgi:hypothetical protein
MLLASIAGKDVSPPAAMQRAGPHVIAITAAIDAARTCVNDEYRFDVAFIWLPPVRA